MARFALAALEKLEEFNGIPVKYMRANQGVKWASLIGFMSDSDRASRQGQYSKDSKDACFTSLQMPARNIRDPNFEHFNPIDYSKSIGVEGSMVLAGNAP